MPFPKKKKPDLAILVGEEEPEPEGDMAEMPDEDDLGDEDGDFGDMPEEDPLEGPLAAEGDDPFGDMASDIDPEQAALAETLGFTEPDQQQALIDLIKLVTSAAPDSMGTESSSALPPLPESTY